MSNPAIQDLQRQLREKFPNAHQSRPVESSSFSTGLPAFPKGALSELFPATPTTSLALVLAELLHSAEDPSSPGQTGHNTPSDSSFHVPHSASGVPSLGLIDGRDSFDPASYGPAACSRLLWVRCQHADESLRCTDLLLRDGNLPLLVLDLQLTPPAELNAIPTSSWYRLRNLAQQSGTTLLAFTSRPLIPSATLQLTITYPHQLHDLESPNKLTKQIQTETPKTERQRARS